MSIRNRNISHRFYMKLWLNPKSMPLVMRSCDGLPMTYEQHLFLTLLRDWTPTAFINRPNRTAKRQLRDARAQYKYLLPLL